MSEEEVFIYETMDGTILEYPIFKFILIWIPKNQNILIREQFSLAEVLLMNIHSLMVRSLLTAFRCLAKSTGGPHYLAFMDIRTAFSMCV